MGGSRRRRRRRSHIDHHHHDGPCVPVSDLAALEDIVIDLRARIQDLEHTVATQQARLADADELAAGLQLAAAITTGACQRFLN